MNILTWDVIKQMEGVPLAQHCRGNAQRLIHGEAKPRKWVVTIEALLKTDTDLNEKKSWTYQPDDKLRLQDLLHLASQHASIDICDELQGRDVIELKGRAVAK